MKKILSIMAVIAIATQTTVAQQTTSFGITAGAITSNYSFEYEEVSPKFDSKVGFTFGFMSNIPISKSLSFQPAINYVQKGFSGEDQGITTTVKLNYLELPINFVYNAPGKNGHFFIGAGPSIAYGIAAKVKEEDSPEEKLHFGSEEGDALKPVEIGANILMGYQFANGFNIAANYNRGLNNVSVDGSTKENNYYFGLRIGYMLTGKSKK